MKYSFDELTVLAQQRAEVVISLVHPISPPGTVSGRLFQVRRMAGRNIAFTIRPTPGQEGLLTTVWTGVHYAADVPPGESTIVEVTLL